ncbi:MAG: hypothetical protein R3202_06095 [Candidatus Competibacterales bacterium]|nr:hypothetical protein [Candidatus Competibacterales bacterium]
MVTNGLLLLASIEFDEIQIHEADTMEYRAGPTAGARLLEARANRAQDRSDLRAILTDPGPPFAFFDIHAPNERLASLGVVGIRDYVADGGRIRDMR